MMSSGLFTIAQSDQNYPDIDVYLPATGFSGVNVPATRVDFDSADEPRAGEHPSVAQVIGQDQTVTGISVNFGKTTGQTALRVQPYLLVSAGGTGPFFVAAGCPQIYLPDSLAVSESCGDLSIALEAGDEIALYIHAYTDSTSDGPADFYGSFAVTTSTP
ncbi:MAG: hypothetical protein JWN91_631 [Nocardioides sp.]|nr:hypothetical protein [Nocardioides sp.]